MSDACIISLENQWKTKTVAANALFNTNDFNAAIDEYNKALYKAEALNMNSTDCLRVDVPYVQIFIISCNNLAYAYEGLGDIKTAEKMLKRSVYYLLSLVNNKASNPQTIQSELKRATLTYSDFVDKTGKEKLGKEQVFKQLKEGFLNEECTKK